MLQAIPFPERLPMLLLLRTRESDQSTKPEDWNDLFMSLANVYRDYSITAVNAVSGATAYAESTVKARTGKYACAVSAALTVCTYYVNTGGLSSLASDYDELWPLIDAAVDKENNGIIYGSTKKRGGRAGGENILCKTR